MGPLRAVRGARDRDDVVGADRVRRRRSACRVERQAAGGRVAPDDPDRDPGRGRIGEVGQPAVPVAVVEQDRPGGLDVELDRAPRPWPRTSPARPRRVRRPRPRRSPRPRSPYGCSRRVVRHRADDAHAGWPADRGGRASPAGCPRRAAPPPSSRPSCDRRPGGPGASSPAAPDDHGRDVRGVVAGTGDARSSGPSGRGRAGRPRRPAGRSPRAPAPTRHQIARRGGHAVDEQQRPAAGSPQASAENGIPAAIDALRSPAAGCAAAATSAAVASSGRHASTAAVALESGAIQSVVGGVAWPTSSSSS